MKITTSATDDDILRELGERFTKARLELNLTQAELAARAGVAKRTIERLENGEAGTRLSGLVRICRALGLAERLNLLAPETAPGPMEMLRLRGRERCRASGSRFMGGGTLHRNNGGTPAFAPMAPMKFNKKNTTTNATAAPASGWKWGDEK
ncbi:MAG: helix-turn-helix domain-containing protein [Puniceicoccales bacterium]|jgi:DNA-binding XRE family transcriptional regulator|nr:helix-turn-helix domain-containing protein [Puniceicoccales bacterium]